MGDFILGFLCILSLALFAGGVVWSIWFSISRNAHDQKFIDKVTVTLNSLNDDPQNEELADSLIKICEDLKQVYSPSILFGLQIIQCYPVHAVFGLLMLKDTGEVEGQIPVELLRKLRRVTGDTFPVIGMDKLLFVGNQARRYFPDYPDHEKNNYRLSVRVKDWKGLEKPQSVISRSKQEENIEGVAERSRSPQGKQGVNSDEGAEIAQWIYPSQLLSTPQSAFDFPEYPGLSVAMRLYIVIGKVVYFATGVLVPLALLAMFILFISHENGDFAGPRAVLFLVFAVPVLVITLLLMNLGLAFQFASAEIIKVWVRNEENTRTVKKLLEKQTQTEDE